MYKLLLIDELSLHLNSKLEASSQTTMLTHPSLSRMLDLGYFLVIRYYYRKLKLNILLLGYILHL